MPRLKLFRWKAIVPLGVFLVLIAVVWMLFLDVVVERGVERAGAMLVGAKVDLAEADVRLREGSVILRGLEVTNPDHPMTNLVQADEIVVDIRKAPLLLKKLIIDTVALRGIRFGTPRAESGALDNPPAGSGRIWREIDGWAETVRVPPFSLEGLGQVVNVGAIQPESLQTVAAARGVRAFADSLGGTWDRQLSALNPGPMVDSTRALITRLQQADPVRLGVSGVTNLANSARTTLTSVQDLRRGVASLDSTARGELDQARARVAALAQARSADYAYALGLVHLPSLHGPDISPSVFGDVAVQWVRPVLYWLRAAEEYLPPGLDPRRYTGEKRTRRPGTTVLFPSRDGLPRFLLEHGEADLELGGTGVTAGQYSAQISGLTSAPTLYGKPFRMLVERAAAARGPSDLRVSAMLDHVSAPIRDSLAAAVRGVRLPTIDLGMLGARLTLGDGSSELSLQRSGDQIAARWSWQTGNATWERLQRQSAVEEPGADQPTPDTLSSDTRPPTPDTAIGSQNWARDLLWRAVSGVSDVQIDVRLSGDIRHPDMHVASNVGDVIAQSLRRELGAEVQRAETEVRARVNALVEDEMARAQTAVDSLRSKVTDQIAPQATRVTELEAQLQQEIRNLTRRLPGGLRIP